VLKENFKGLGLERGKGLWGGVEWYWGIVRRRTLGRGGRLVEALALENKGGKKLEGE